MNVALLLIISLPLFWLGYHFYGRYIAGQLGEDPQRKTPAVQINDGRDYVPTPTPVLFAHHYATIAGAGPIIGPTIALFYGVIPVWLWLVIGGIFIGAVHDFTSLFVSLRESGKSMAQIANKSLGRWGFLLFISFTLIMIILVTAAFLGLTVKALTSLVPLRILGVVEGETILKTVVEGGIVKGKIGGIASTSVIVMTLFAPLLGFLLYRRKLKVLWGSILAVTVAIFSIIVGLYYPIQINPLAWMIIISVYVFFAAGIPIWFVLQPRDFINVHILYAGIAAMVLGIIGYGLKGGTINAPLFNIAEASSSPALGFIWPVMFITVACGAISGFHALVSGGTTSKQLSKEGDAKKVGYGGMILESLLSVCVVLVLATGLAFADYKSIVFPPGLHGSNPVLAFALAVGGLLRQGLGIPMIIGTIFGILMVEGFIVTTLDTAVRLNRYLFEELWGIMFHRVPRIIKSYWFNAAISVALMFSLAHFNAYLIIWPIFGTGNQLLAALTLIAISAWLFSKGKKYWFTLIPAIFMMITTLVSLVFLLTAKYLPAGNIPLIVADILLLLLSGGVIFLGFRKFLFRGVQGGLTQELKPGETELPIEEEERKFDQLLDSLHD